MRMRLIWVALVAMTLMAVGAAPVDAKATGAERADVVREFTDQGQGTDGSESIGWTNLVRKPSGISGTTHVSGLEPGVYTFWVVAIDPSFFPDETDFSLIHLARGASAVVKANGPATVHWSASTGDESIVTPGPVFGTLDDPEGRGVRIEIAYHGEVPEDGVPASWLENFWDGEEGVCAPIPFGSPGPIIAGQPHCPVFFASTHHPA